jgi:O-antigen/teichoic acid export membrane protein
MNRKIEKSVLPDEGRQIIRETTTYGVSTYLSQVIFLVRGVVIARFLDPSLYGIWSVIKVFLYFSAYMGLGTANAMSREVPYHRGRGEDWKDEGIVSTSLFVTLAVALLAALVVLVWSFSGQASPYSWEIRLSAAFFVTSAIHFYIPVKLNGEQKIMDLSRYMIAYTLFTSLFGLLLMFVYGLKGLLGGMLAAALLLHAVMVITGRLPYPPSFSAKIAARLFVTGFPIMVLSACFFMMHSMDKLIVFSILGATNTGYYGLASFLSSLVYCIPSSISAVLFPRMMGDRGRLGSKMDENAYFFSAVASAFRAYAGFAGGRFYQHRSTGDPSFA